MKKMGKPEAWTGALVGRMHNECILWADLADELGYCRTYVGQILNGKRRIDGMQQRMEKAVDRIIERRAAGERDAR